MRARLTASGRRLRIGQCVPHVQQSNPSSGSGPYKRILNSSTNPMLSKCTLNSMSDTPEIVAIEDNGVLFLYEEDTESENRQVRADTCISSDYWIEVKNE